MCDVIQCYAHTGKITLLFMPSVEKMERYERRPSKHRNSKLTAGRKRFEQDPGSREAANLLNKARARTSAQVCRNARRASELPTRPVRRIIAHSSGGSQG